MTRRATSLASVTRTTECAADHLAHLTPALARRIRALRAPETEWSVRTSELFSTSARRVLVATDQGRAQMGRGQFAVLWDTIVRRALIDRIRRAIVRRRALTLLRAQGDHGGASGQDECMADSMATARAVLDGLSHDERIMVAARVDGQQWHAIALRLGINEDAARQRWTAMRRRLRRFYPDEG